MWQNIGRVACMTTRSATIIQKLSFSLPDIDECEADLCHQEASCMNTDGSYICTCNRGYFGNGLECSGKHFCL